MLAVCYPRCSTCKKAVKWLEDNGIEYTYRDIKEDNPTEEELREWHATSGLPLKRFFNTSGMLYRDMQLKDNLLVCFVRRKGKTFIPTGQDCLQVGDRVMIVTKHSGFNELTDILA
jgi:hypothetical protein